MPRIPKSYIEGVVYYITSRGDNNEDIFKDDEDFKAYIKLIKKYKEQYGFKLFAFILLANHLHLLVELKEGSTISNILHDIHSSYTKYFNTKYQRKGHVFQERYKMVAAEKKSYLLALSAYIHLNPQALQPKQGFAEYAYTSYRIYAGLDSPGLGGIGLNNEADEIKQELAAANFDSYSAYLNSIGKEKMNLLGKELNKSTLLGPQGFIEKINAFLDASQKQAAVDSIAPARQKRFSLAAVLVFCILAGVTVFLIKENMFVKQRIERKVQQKEYEFSERLAKERVFINKDLQEKYKADMVSFQALSKRLEIEKQKTQELENKAAGKK